MGRVCRRHRFPEAFTSAATHFTPIILTNEWSSEEGGSRHIGAVIRRTKSSEHMQAKGLDPLPPFRSDSPEPDLHAQELPVRHTVITTTSVDNLPVNSTSTLPNMSFLEVSLPPPSPSELGTRGIFNNYLFRQDPTTGRLCLVPVQVRPPESLLGLDMNLSLVPRPLRGQIAGPESVDGPFIKRLHAPGRPGPRDCGPPSSHFNGGSVLPDGALDRGVPRACSGQTNPGTQDSESIPPEVHPAKLLGGDRSLDGHLADEHEDIGLGECIFSLKDFQYPAFASVVKEKFGDLYWEDDLLAVLHCLVSCSPSPLGSNEEAPSKAVNRAALPPPLVATARRAGREVIRLHLDGNAHASGPAAVGCEALPCHGGEEAPLKDLHLRAGESLRCIFQGMSAGSSEAVAMEGGGRESAGGSDKSPSEVEFPSGKGEDEEMSPDRSEEMEDSESLVSERLVSPGSRAEGPPAFSSGPTWASAFFGEECFGPEVIQYAVNLGQHTGSPGLDVKTQELQQQLMIETRNLKKTQNFFQKLIQQERKNKGENKQMLSKLKSQLEELRSKVVFLDCVKKYLEVLSVDEWGVDVSLLPALAVCGRGSLDLQSSEDSSVLSFGTSKGKRALQAGSPLGLMAYLYARNAAVDGFIQQFLYTYRFLCTPKQLLQFIMDKFICAARQGPDMSGDAVKIFHRSLDLLQLWITDCKQVDFMPMSDLVDTLERFLNTEVIPLDSRGEALLAALHSPAHRTLIRGNQVSFEEDDFSMCLHSSTDDLGRKWRFSRAVEPSASLPKDKAFSIAAALPVPCRGSLADDPPAAFLQSEERLPFSRNEKGAQHVTQQLTLLQQEMFKGCHPVHFLNSRIQGVGGKVSSPNKNVSLHIPPAEGSRLLECEEAPSDSRLQQLLTYADGVANWISAEVVSCDSVKTQVALLTKYLWVGKHCYEARNFATAMQVLGGLDNVIVRQLPAWKHLSSKVCEILEELRAVQVFLKSDDLCLMGGEHARRRPTLPSAHILAMHVQQLEIGAFTLTTGAYKWTKLRSIAKVVSQVHAFQEAVYPYSPDPELQAYLRRRIARLATSDIHLLAAENDGNFHQSSERQTRRIQDQLRRVKATFQ